MRLSPNFTYAEMTRSHKAKQLNLDNTPTVEVVGNLRRLCAELEKIRALIDGPLVILSGYRSPAVNAAVGGSKNSYHMRGLAADFDPPRWLTHDEFQKKIAAAGDVVFDLVLEEKALDGGHWLHFQIPEEGKPARRLVRDAELDRVGGTITRTTAG